MSVAAETPITSALANGVTTVFPYAWTLLDADDLVVQGTTGGVTTTYPSSAYTVSGIGLSAGSVTFAVAPASGIIITMYRDTALLRDTDYQDNGDLLADSVNLDFDRLWMAMQDILTGGKASPSAIRVPNGETVNVLPVAASRAGYFLGFDGSGEPALLAASTGTAAALAADLATSSDAAKGDALLGVKRTDSAGALGETLHFYIQSSPIHLSSFLALDGVTDDSTKLAAIFADITSYGGGHVILNKAGTLALGAKVTLPENLTIEGWGKDVSKIKVNAAVVGFEKVYATHTNVNRLNLVMRNLQMTGAATALGGIKLDLVDYFDFENVSFKDFQATGAYGARLVQAWRGGFERCHFEDIDTYGLLQEFSGGVGCNHTWVNNSEIIGNNQATFVGLTLRGQQVTVTRNDISGSGNGLHGIVIEESEGIHIEKNYIEAWTGQAIKANTGTASSRITVDRNILSSSGVPCLNFDHASVNDNVIVTRNRFSDMGAGQTCIDFGTTTNAVEFGNDPDVSQMTDTYSVAQKAVGANLSTFTGTLTGCTTAPTAAFRYEKVGKNVTLYMPSLIGTSNATTCTVTGMPTIITPARQQFVLALQRDNTSSDFIGELRVENTGVLTLCRQVGSAGGFTAANNKGLLGTTISYSLD